MRRTFKNFCKVIEKKEQVAWRNLKFAEKEYGKESVERQKALSEWVAMNSVRFMLESQDAFDNAYETWCK